jgi:hypothetical protein
MTLLNFTPSTNETLLWANVENAHRERINAEVAAERILHIDFRCICTDTQRVRLFSTQTLCLLCHDFAEDDAGEIHC